MIFDSILAHARTAPNRIAARMEGNALSFRDLAGLLGVLDAQVAAMDLPVGGAVVVWAPRPVGNWLLCQALRRHGVSVLPVRQPAAAATLNLAGIDGIVTLGAPGLDAAGLRLRRHCDVPLSALETASASGPETGAALPGPRDNPGHPPGGHFLLSSGTTGLHKRILIDAATEAELIARYRQSHVIDAETYAWNGFGAWTMWGFGVVHGTWDAGGCVWLHDDMRDYTSLWREDWDLAVITPGMLRDAMLMHPGRRRRNLNGRLFIGGGPFPGLPAPEARERLCARLVNAFGCTEVGPIAFTPVERPEDEDRNRPQPFAEIEIVDENHVPQPAGTEGMIRIRAFGSMMGYADDAEATETFFRDGFFYTGDLGIIDAGGTLVFRGRVTDVINLAGDKISPVPIEAELEAELGGRAVYVFGVRGPWAMDDLHVVVEGSAPLPAGEQERLRQRRTLSRFQQVTFHNMATLPRTDVGKPQRRLLRQMLLGSDAA